MPAVPVTAFITWAHRNTDWDDQQTATWATTVRGFAELLIRNGIDADLDLFHVNDPAVAWSRFGPGAIQEADFVLIVVSSAWRERWEGTNDPTTGAGAVGEANTLRGLFEQDQARFQRKTQIVVLPGAANSDIPPELSVLNRFALRTLEDTDAVLDDLLRTLTGQPRYLRPTLGEPRRFDPEPPVAEADKSARSRPQWLAAFATASESRTRQRQSGAGLSSVQLDAVKRFRPSVPDELRFIPEGSLRILAGELGSGKSEIAEQWLRERVDAGEDACALPLWVSVEDLDTPLESVVLSRLDQVTLESVGVDLVVDGLDQRSDRARNTVRQASEICARWPKATIVITSRPLPDIDPALPIRVPDLTDYQSALLMSAIAGRSLPELDDALEQAARRPLFALLIAQHASDAAGVTGMAELIDLVIDDVVHDASRDLYPLLRRLAAETLRSGGPVDPARFCDAPDAAALRNSHLVTRTGRRCRFSLATFEQWFAARAILEGDVDLPALLTSLAAFDRWKYALSIILAAAEPVRADAVMAAVMRWNPGAAAWLIGDMGRGGLSRRRSAEPGDAWETAGARIREATSAALDGLGPLANCIDLLTATPTGSVDELSLAIDIDIDAGRLTFGWTLKQGYTGYELPAVIRIQDVVHRTDRPWGFRELRLPSAENWPWLVVRDSLADDIAKRLVAVTNQVLGSSDSGIARAELDAARAATYEHGMYPFLAKSQTHPPIYPSPDLPPSGAAAEPWARFSVERMLQRAEAIVEATMRLYLELTDLLTPAFGDTLAHRGLMPVEFFGTISYEPDTPRGHFDLPGPYEPGLRWLLRPIGDANRVRPFPEQNKVSLTANDTDRARKIFHDRQELYSAFRAYVEANPAYQDFAAPFSAHDGGLDVFQPRPATKLALLWLAEDLKQLGWFEGNLPTSL